MQDDCVPKPPPMPCIGDNDADNALIMHDAHELAAVHNAAAFIDSIFANDDGEFQLSEQDTAGDTAGDMAGLEFFDNDKHSFSDTMAVQSLLNPDFFDGQSSQIILDRSTSTSKENAKTLPKQRVTYPSTPGPTFIQCFKTRQAKTVKQQVAKQQTAAPFALAVAEQQEKQENTNMQNARAITIEVTARKGKGKRNFNEAILQSVMHLRQADASARLGISLSTLKKLCRQLHLQWPKKFPEDLMQVSMITTSL
jgi:hypothetical protein